MSISSRGPHFQVRVFTLMLAALSALTANVAYCKTLDPSPYCKEHFETPRPTPHSGNLYALLLVFDAASADAVHAYFHTVASDPDHYGCVADPRPGVASPAKAKAPGKPPGVVAQGSCPTDCIPPWAVPPGGKGKKLRKPNPDDPLDGEDWGIFSADAGENQILVWQILTKKASHASEILAQIKGDSNFPKASFRGHVLIGFHAP